MPQQAVAHRLEFAPPPHGGTARALAFALLAHLVLLAALTWGVQWKRQSEDRTVEAELWSAVSREAAPAAVEPPPAPPAPEPPAAAAPEPPPAPTQADIALEREKRKREQARLDAEARALKDKQDRSRAEQKRLNDKKLADAKKATDARRLADARKKQEAIAKELAREQEDARKLEVQRQQNLMRMAGMAGATGRENAKGDAPKASGPSASYGGRIRAAVRPNIVFSADVAGNPAAEVEVRCASDGTITGMRLLKSSGVKAWDDAVLKALEKTAVLPRDTDGRVISPLLISFRPKD
ncbi:MAG: cell envelope integrity protein TolA [Burkholderiaceae bacterium]|nr:cell envelope integrity protein TolA [Burkholderiaceae bacterium]MDO9088809.1 cell envelope integrity protein TolA [Burkholderiaceae bacterium]